MRETNIKKIINLRPNYFNELFVETLYDEALEVKINLKRLLSNHPDWDEKNTRIVRCVKMERQIFPNAINVFKNNILPNVLSLKGKNVYCDLEYVLAQLKHCAEQCGEFCNDSVSFTIDAINDTNPNYKLRTNMKISKMIYKVCREEGIADEDFFKKAYPVVADALCPMEETFLEVISINPLDFARMSFGSSWRSCHNIIDGEFSGGPVSWMLDPLTFIYYQVPIDTKPEDISTVGKVRRQIFAFDKNQMLLFQSRLYPQANDCFAKDTYAKINANVKDIINACLETPISWKTSYDATSMIESSNEDGNAIYEDWYEGYPGARYCSVSVPKECTRIKKIYLGKQRFCLSCGDRIVDNEDEHNGGFKSVCDKCYY